MACVLKAKNIQTTVYVPKMFGIQITWPCPCYTQAMRKMRRGKEKTFNKF